jgi:iron complex transport system substrate-binding protein
MRICSFVPAATEVLFALGLGDSVVGVTHECDFPAEAASRPVLSASSLDTSELSSAEIDAAVSRAAQNGTPLYAVDAEGWAELEADVVVVQELCHVCAVTTDDLDEVVRADDVEVETVEYSPSTVDEILASIVGMGVRFDAEAQADELTGGMRARFRRVEAALADVDARPRVFVSEWLEPPYSAGHWVPDMVALAGGTDVAGTVGEPSHRMRWSDVAALEPDVVVLAPCGFDLDRTLGEVATFELSAHLLGTAARQESRVFAVDGNANFSRPGPRVADGVELLAHLFHPGAYPDPGAAWSRVRL